MKRITWGGSLNKKGSAYLKKHREADKTILFLESLKKELKTEEQMNLNQNH